MSETIQFGLPSLINRSIGSWRRDIPREIFPAMSVDFGGKPLASELYGGGLHQFVWVVRTREKIDEKEEENWLPDGFEERMRDSNKGEFGK